jgi:sodium-dependent dicarboxylate transporter 2/3/5
LFVLPIIFTASCAFLLPLDAVPLVTYSAGYYKFYDMWKPGLVISIAWVIVMTAVMMIFAPMLGLI